MSEKNEIGFCPSSGEKLLGYAERLQTIIAENRGYLQKHVQWFTHYGMGQCPICDIQAVSEYLCSILIDISNEMKSKNIHLEAVHPSGTKDASFFEFKLKGRK